jgi:lysophospholipase L1-like esterase
MKRPGWKRALVAGAMFPMAGVLVLQGLKIARTLRVGRGIISAATAFGHRPTQPAMRVLIMGDSTGVGVGAQAAQSLAALLAADRPDAELLNVSRSGARLDNIAEQLRHLPQPGQRWDLLLLHAGGNDVLRGTPPAQLRRCVDDLLSQLVPLARVVVWLGPPDVGLLPAFVPPFSWLLSRRSIRACEVFRQGAERFGVRFIDFCEPREKAFFTADPSRFIAADQVHPTAEGYRHCYRVLRKALPEL